MNKVEKLRSAIKKKDGWWASIFSGPLANKFLEPICDIKWISPNLITIVSMIIGLIAALCFATGQHFYLIIGAILVQLSFIVDCMDGQLARYRQEFSNLGAWLDRISDRVKDFFYFFGIAWGFFISHQEHFHLGLGGFANFLAHIFGENVFKFNSNIQTLLLKHIEIDSWIIWPLAMLAMFGVFLIDYYVNQDMKLEVKASSQKQETQAKPSALKSSLVSFFKFGLSVYKSIPILRFNIGEQALLISIFTAFDASFCLMIIFALLGSFYSVYWPVAKYYGMTPEK